MGQGFEDADRQTPLYFRTTDEMLQEFEYLGSDLAYQVVIKNPNDLAEQIESVRPIPEEFFPPKIPGAEEEIREIIPSSTIFTHLEPLEDPVSFEDTDLERQRGNRSEAG